ncbi:DENND5 [Acanthosepion pharaonis]|uniref:DENND5 n=1 Tax=Acanthosepion pharaonis TaxID=158019 RepID=A0A812E3N9_ACAPH|nr:DENND5 [Sepia pharaonis]
MLPPLFPKNKQDSSSLLTHSRSLNSSPEKEPEILQNNETWTRISALAKKTGVWDTIEVISSDNHCNKEAICQTLSKDVSTMPTAELIEHKFNNVYAIHHSFSLSFNTRPCITSTFSLSITTRHYFSPSFSLSFTTQPCISPSFSLPYTTRPCISFILAFLYYSFLYISFIFTFIYYSAMYLCFIFTFLYYTALYLSIIFTSLYYPAFFIVHSCFPLVLVLVSLL